MELLVKSYRLDNTSSKFPEQVAYLQSKMAKLNELLLSKNVTVEARTNQKASRVDIFLIGYVVTEKAEQYVDDYLKGEVVL